MLGCHANLNVISAARCLYGHACCQSVIMRAAAATCRGSSTSTRRSQWGTLQHPWAWWSSCRCTPFGRSHCWTRSSNTYGRVGTPSSPSAPVLCLCRSLQGRNGDQITTVLLWSMNWRYGRVVEKPTVLLLMDRYLLTALPSPWQGRGAVLHGRYVLILKARLMQWFDGFAVDSFRMPMILNGWGGVVL